MQRSRTRAGLLERAIRAAILGGGAVMLALVGVQAVLAESPSPSAAPDAGASGSPAPTETARPSGSSAPASTRPPASPVASGKADTNTCYSCHTQVDGKQHTIADTWKGSIHAANGIGCADCHGGDPTSDKVTTAMDPNKGFKGVPDRQQTVGVCGTCHSDVERMRQYQIPTDQFAKYKTSVHGQKLLANNDTKVAICTDCHGTHDVKKASDPTSKVYPLNVPELCASCHADGKYMETYGIPTDQLDVYKGSVHGEALLLGKDMRAPNCASCHGSHDAQPPTSATVVDVCGKCHTATQALYDQSRHAEVSNGPKCWTCHGTHDVVKPSEARFFHPTPPQIDCATCHNLADRSLKLNADKFQNDDDRRCDTCHHPDSLLYSQAQGLKGALDKAATAYDEAVAKINEAALAGMIVADADVTVTQSKTALIQARAAVHTTKLTDVGAKTDAAIAKALEAEQFAQARLDESFFRRQAMIVVLALIAVTVLALMLLRRGLDHDYEHAP